MIGLGFNLAAFTVLTFARHRLGDLGGDPAFRDGGAGRVQRRRRLLSRSVDETRQGEVQGISASLNAIAYF